MTKGSKVFRPTDVPESNSSSYPEPFREGQLAGLIGPELRAATQPARR
jgi:hypothetical protein